MRTGKDRWLLAVVIGIFGMPYVQSIDVSAASPQGVLKQAIHWAVSADFLDPRNWVTSGGGHVPLYLFHDALLKPMPDGTYSPCLAESWNISPDFKVYEFKLRRGVRFHNGDTMTSEDVVFSFWRNRSAPGKNLQNRTEAVEAVNPYLVRIRFKDPFPDFLEYLLPGVSTMGWVVPKKYVEKVGDAAYGRHPVGAGSYKFVEFNPGVRLVAEAFEDFWRKVPHVKRLEFYTVMEPATRLAMVRRGEVDISYYMGGVVYEDLKRDPKLRTFGVPSPTQWLVYISAQWDPKSPWSDPRVRKAASLAIDRQTLADTHSPGSSPIGSLGFEGEPFMVRFPPDPYDPEKARKLLAEAGYPKGFHGGKFWPWNGAYWPYCEQVANYWKAVGITFDTILLERPAVIANREGGKMKGGVFVDMSAPPTITGRLAYLFGPTSYGNYPDIQTLWDQYRRAVDPNARKDLIMRIQGMIQERTMWIPLTTTVSIMGVGPRVKGDPWKVQPLLWFTAPFEDIELEK